MARRPQGGASTRSACCAALQARLILAGATLHKAVTPKRHDRCEAAIEYLNAALQLLNGDNRDGSVERANGVSSRIATSPHG